jgi:iduronate 2-sulfatase
MRYFQSFLVVLICLCFASLASAAVRPNVLLICIDDLKPAIGCYGDNLAITPNIDRLAARGMRFDAAYCNQAVCAPSRNALLTSLRPTSIGIYDLGTNFRKGAPDAVTLPQYFKQHGYRTEGMGKIFHVGHGNDEDAASWSVPHWRAKVVQYALEESAPQGGTREEALFSNIPGSRAQALPKGAAYEAADVPDDEYFDGQLANHAIDRLKQAASNPDEPFFMAVGFVKPHLPFCAPQKYWDMHDAAKFSPATSRTRPDGAPPYAPTNWAELRNYSLVPNKGPLSDDLQRTLIHGYYAATSYMDAQLGKVLDALEQTGLAENTIVVLWGDHGWHLGDHGMWSKHTNYEQAARIPIIVVTPDEAAKGAATSALVESVDIYPTLCELAGLPAPQGIEGASFAKVLADSSAKTKDAIFHVFPRGELVEWKIPGAAPETAELELYDYQADPGESKNLAADSSKVVAELRAILNKQPEAKPQIKMPAAHTKGSGRRTGATKVPKPKNIVTREQWGSKPDPIPDSRRHMPEWITLHHAGVLWTNSVEPAQFVRNMQSWGKRRPEIEKPPRDTYWPDLAYHFMIAPDGKIYEARPVEYEPESNTKYDLAGNLGVEMMGNFDEQRPSRAQIRSAVRLTAWLMSEHGIDIDHVRTHRDAAPNQTGCPGRDFYRYFEDGKFKQWVTAVLNGKNPRINPGPPLDGGPTELITAARSPAKQ